MRRHLLHKLRPLNQHTRTCACRPPACAQPLAWPRLPRSRSPSPLASPHRRRAWRAGQASGAGWMSGPSASAMPLSTAAPRTARWAVACALMGADAVRWLIAIRSLNPARGNRLPEDDASEMHRHHCYSSPSQDAPFSPRLGQGLVSLMAPGGPTATGLDNIIEASTFWSLFVLMCARAEAGMLEMGRNRGLALALSYRHKRRAGQRRRGQTRWPHPPAGRPRRKCWTLGG
jgi:hypothetical protein